MVKISLFFLVFVLITAWLFSGWPQIWKNPPIPPKIQEARAESIIQSASTIASARDNTLGCASDGWESETNSNTQNDTYDSITNKNYDTNDVGHRLTHTNFGFSIPDGSAIDGVVIKIESHASAGGAQDEYVHLFLAGSVDTSENKALTASPWTASDDDVYITYGGENDEWSIAGGLSEADVEDTEFGVIICVEATADNTDVHVDHIEMTVYYTPPITTFLIGGTETGTKDTAVTTITFPEGSPAATITAPYNDVDGSGDPQVLHATVSEPVVKIKNTHASQTYNVVLEITTWTNSVVNMEYYNLATDGATNIETVTAELSNANGAARTVSTGVSIAAGTYKDLYLKLVLGSVAGKSGISTLTILGEVP